MLVLVPVAKFDLADPAGGTGAVDLCQDPDLQAPVAGDPVDPGKIRQHRELTGQRVTKTVHEHQQRDLPPENLHQRTQQRGDQQPRHPAIELVGDPGIVSLAELVIHVRAGEGEHQPREQFALVGEDVAVMQRNNLAGPVRQHQPGRHPHVAALARPADREFALDHQRHQALDPRPIPPDNPYLLGQDRKIFAGMIELGAVGAVEPDHDLADVAGPLQMLDNIGQRLTRQLAV